MIVYSKKIIQFIHEIKQTVKDLLSREICLKVYGDRFYDHKNEASYPVKVVIYNHKSMLGYFDSAFYELGFHESLMHVKKEQLHQIISHELAHYITFIHHGAAILPHGAEFRSFCQQMGWGEEVFCATICLESGKELLEEESAILRKVQKLMALASSSQAHEAEQAMIKAQQLLLKHNIETKYLGSEEEEKMYLKRIMKQKKENAKMRSISRILETFFVSTVYHRGEGFIYLEILGSEVNIEIAEYVANFLDSELERLWKQVQRNTHLKGMIAKNSFFIGLAKGYCNKIQALKREYHADVANALMVIEKKLTEAKAMAYPHLSSFKSSGYHCSESSALGEQMGRHLNINSALHQTRKSSDALISYSG